MKIQKAITAVPANIMSGIRRRKSKHTELWKVLESNLGLWVPIKCDNEHELRNLQAAVKANRSHWFNFASETRAIGLTLYIRMSKRIATKGLSHEI